VAIGKTNAGGGGSSGATLTITGVVGATVTVSKDGKTYTRTINNSGTAVFKGLSTGTWTVTMSGNGQTTTRTVEIVADYSLTIAYFSATIAVTYPANSACVIKNSSGVQVASDTNAGTSEKTWTAIVGATGTYTIIATVMDSSGKTKSTTVSITTDGQSESVTLTYELILFDGGDNTGVTGGWKGKNVTPTVSNVLSFSITNTDATFPKAASVYTENKIDLSKYNKLTVIKSEANGWYIGVAENKFSWSTYPPGVADIGFIAYANLHTSDTRIELDISGINTECYVATYEMLGSINPEVGAKTSSATLTNITLS
jgi:hypothetical protein